MHPKISPVIISVNVTKPIVVIEAIVVANDFLIALLTKDCVANRADASSAITTSYYQRC